MSDPTYQSTTATIIISTAVILVLILVGLATFGISSELNKARQMAGLAAYDDFDPDSLPAPAAGMLKQPLARSTNACEDVILSATQNGTRYVREAGGGIYYAAEVDSRFSIYTVSYGHLVAVDKSGVDAHTYRKLKHALYHCDGVAGKSGLYVVREFVERPPV